jgi:hypothetical protein
MQAPLDTLLASDPEREASGGRAGVRAGLPPVTLGRLGPARHDPEQEGGDA